MSLYRCVGVVPDLAGVRDEGYPSPPMSGRQGHLNSEVRGWSFEVPTVCIDFIRPTELFGETGPSGRRRG